MNVLNRANQLFAAATALDKDLGQSGEKQVKTQRRRNSHAGLEIDETQINTNDDVLDVLIVMSDGQIFMAFSNILV